MGLALIWASCSTPTEGPPVEEANPNDTIVAFNHVDFPLQITMNKQVLSNAAPRMELNSATGVYHVEIGERFQINVVEDSVDLDSFKQELLDDQLFLYKFFDEGEGVLSYQAILPTGEDHYYHLAKMCRVDGKNYFIQSSDEQDFTLLQIKEMKQVLASLESRE